MCRCASSPALQELNVLPFIAMAANCFSWIIYGYVGLDWYIYFGNIPGLMFGMFYVLTCYKFSKEQVRLSLGLVACLIVCLAELSARVRRGTVTHISFKMSWL